jgi:hypothetical protein
MGANMAHPVRMSRPAHSRRLQGDAMTARRLNRLSQELAHLSRRRVLPLLLALPVTIALTGASMAGSDWDGTWHGGFDSDGNGAGDGVQLIVTGGKVLGFYYHGDYLDTDDGTTAADGAITFHWEGGEGRLSATGGGRQLSIHETGTADRTISLERDN